jgi:DNA-binding PadR family transcriptional regulator
MLHKLEDAGLVTSGEEPSPAKGKPPRRCYRLTELGVADARKSD